MAGIVELAGRAGVISCAKAKAPIFLAAVGFEAPACSAQAANNKQA